MGAGNLWVKLLMELFELSLHLLAWCSALDTSFVGYRVYTLQLLHAKNVNSMKAHKDPTLAPASGSA